MTIPAPVSPDQFKRILEHCGLTIIAESENNWLFERRTGPGRPIPVPKLGALVAVEVMSSILHFANINHRDYFLALEATSMERIREGPAERG